MSKEKSAGCVIFRKEKDTIKYLLLHYKAGHWDFPKGHIEDKEDEVKTALREAEEETGIKDLKIIDGFKEFIKYFFRRTYDLKGEEKKKAPWVFKIVIFYLGETKTKEIKISFEHIDYQWLDYKEALDKLTYKSAKEVLEKANQFITKKDKNK